MKTGSGNNWQIIPMREYPHLCVIRDENGNIIATVQSEYAESIRSLPELFSASREIFERLKDQHKEWGEHSSLARLQKAISRITMGDLEPELLAQVNPQAQDSSD